MELKITDDKENALMGRREIAFYIDGEEKTPATVEVKVELCKRLNLDPDSTIVTKVQQRFGIRRVECTAHSYKEKGALERNEPAHIIEREKKKAAKPAGGSTDEQVTAEAEQKPKKAQPAPEQAAES
jgi:small subunit ribosomal protein S24e